MRLLVSGEMINQFVSGLLIILTLIAVGYAISLILGMMAKRFPFSRYALTIALTPFCMAFFLEKSQITALFFFAMGMVLLGLAIDAIAYLTAPKPVPTPIPIPEQKAAISELPTQETAAIPDEKPEPGMIVWEKAE